MFHKRFFSALLTAAVFFSLSYVQIFAASRNITSLKLDFFRTEELLETGQQSTLSGRIIYNKNPFVFIFQINKPSEQTMYLNEENAYIIKNNILYEISENKEFLEQTCKDFLTWFKSDYGLSQAYFKPSPNDRWLEGNYVLSQWDCYNFENQPLSKIIVYTDSLGRFKRLKMYVDETTLVTDTSLYEFEAAQGYSYPTSVISTSYDQGKAFLETSLGFSNVSFSLSQEDLSLVEKLLKEDKYCNCEYPVKDLSDQYAVRTALIPAAESYRVSIPSVLVSGSFKFYKKFITSQDMSNCPFYPSCSQFMLDAVSANGVFGFFQGIERLKRCTSTEHKRNMYETLSNGKHYDPVPVKEKMKVE